MAKLTHTDNDGKARMVYVGDKPSQKRIAQAKGHIALSETALQLIRENRMKKGDVLAVARIAGINAAKMTSSLIPLCHNIFIEDIDVEASVIPHGVEVIATARTTGKTGIEMEALTATSVALLTVYDMCKAVDKEMVISAIKLVLKHKEDVA